MNKQCKKQQGLRDWLKRNRHAYWSLCMIFILFCYFLPERLVTENYHVMELGLDRAIPFLPGFVYFYIAWFPMLLGMGLWLLLRDGEGFRRYMWFMTAAYLICGVIYLCYPSGQELRPENLEVHRLSTWILSKIYAFDTNTNVLPSLHVIGSVGVIYAGCTTPTICKKSVRAGLIILSVLVSASTVFVKQHAVVDVAAGAVVGLLVCWGVHWVHKLRRGAY